MESAMENKVLEALLVNGRMTVGELSVKTNVSATPLLRCLRFMHQKSLLRCDHDQKEAKLYWRHPSHKAGQTDCKKQLPVPPPPLPLPPPKRVMVEDSPLVARVHPLSEIMDRVSEKLTDTDLRTEDALTKHGVMAPEGSSMKAIEEKQAPKLRPVVPSDPDESRYEAAIRLYGALSDEATSEFLSLDRRSKEFKDADKIRRTTLRKKFVIQDYVPAQEEICVELFNGDQIMLQNFGDKNKDGDPSTIMIPVHLLNRTLEALTQLKNSLIKE